jgi:hypothetical protein
MDIFETLATVYLALDRGRIRLAVSAITDAAGCLGAAGFLREGIYVLLPKAP